MVYIEVVKPTYIPLQTSHESPKDRWRVFAFGHDGNTTCYMVRDNERVVIPCDQALKFVQDGVFEGYAFEPKRLRNDEFKADRSVVFFTIGSMFMTAAGLFLFGKGS